MPQALVVVVVLDEIEGLETTAEGVYADLPLLRAWFIRGVQDERRRKVFLAEDRRPGLSGAAWSDGSIAWGLTFRATASAATLSASRSALSANAAITPPTTTPTQRPPLRGAPIDLLERALLERPGLVDLAAEVEVERTDLEGRPRLLKLCSADLLAAGSVHEATARLVADQTDGVITSCAHRRSVTEALCNDRPTSDEDVLTALRRCCPTPSRAHICRALVLADHLRQRDLTR